MVETRDNKQMDDLLDSLLAGYSAVEPRTGLEIRIRAGLKARAARQQRRWLLAFALSAAVVVLTVVVAKRYRAQAPAPRYAAIQESSPGNAPVPAGMVRSLPQPRTREAVYGRRVRLRGHSDTLILLQIANAVPAEDNLVFEHQKLYLSVAAQQEQVAAEEQQPAAPSISIQHLDVRPVEIKDISSARDIGSER